MSDDQLIDVDFVARRVLETPEAIYSLTPVEAVAMAGFVLKSIDGETPAMSAPPEPAWRPMSATLAAAIATFIETKSRFSEVAQARGAHVASRLNQEAFEALKTRFEEEFPHVHN